MPDVTGVWSSIRPTNNGDNTSADMTVDGIIHITRRDPDTGVVTGFYQDPGTSSPLRAMTGHVNYTSDGYYTIDLSHPVGTGVTRHYEGRLATFDDSGDFPVQVVAGRYTDVVNTNGRSSTTHVEGSCNGAPVMSDALALSGGQDNGTWVATKP